MIKRFFTSAYFVIGSVTLILSLCLWLFSPFIAGAGWSPFAGILWRAVGVALLWVVAGLWMLIRFLRRRRRDRKLTEEIVDSLDADDGAAVGAELGEMKAKLRDAMTRLRKSKLGRRHLYELPWYVMIGPPGAGKTTSIVNSGLQFPLSEEVGAQAIGGVGGTRNCDWWFTNDAVMIDTAGRYTTQESDADTDNAAWLGFLALLKKHRKRQPINGAIVAISLSDLSLQDEITQKGHAVAVRRRLHELRERLGVRFPVYVLFTKADLIAGFTEMFDGLGKEDRGQVWGFTLGLAQGRGDTSPVAAFNDEFAALLERLNAQSLERLQSETDPQRRSLIAGFPSQIASVRQVAHAFMSEVFQDNRFENRHLLRGVYFTSGTQEGNPIDRLMMGMARAFGIGRQAIGSGRGSGRSYFLTRLFEQVIFREAGLVSADDRVERRYRWTRRAAIAAAIVLVLGTGALWSRSFLGNQALIGVASASAAEYRDAAAAIPGSPVGDTDLPAVVPALNVLRDMPGNPTVNQPAPPRALSFGLYQGKVIGSEAAQSYRAALNQHLLPRLLLRLEEQMQANMNDPDAIYEALKIYLILGLQGPMDRNLILDWTARDWDKSYPGAAREAMRGDLAVHLAALIDQPMREIGLNGPLIEQVRAVLAEMPQTDRIYNGILNSPAVTALPKWRPTDGNPVIARAMTRSSGTPLNEGIEGVFTRCGFQQVFEAEALSVTERLQGESWVLGDAGDTAQSDAATVRISAGVFQLYFTDFVGRYEALLGDLDIVPLQSLTQAVEVTNVLSSPASPITNVLEAVADQTRLTQGCGGVDTAAVGDGVASVVTGEIDSLLSVRQRILKESVQQSVAASGGQQDRPLGAQVEDRFAWLQTLVARPEGQPSQLDQFLGLLTEVYQEMNKLSFNGGVGQGTEAAAIQRLQQASAQMPGPLPRWSTQITTGSSGISADGTRASINGRWQSEVLPFCVQALGNRYPFDRRAKADVGLQDFVRLFSPGGLIDAFFAEHLQAHANTQTNPWSWNSVNGVDLGVSEAVLAQFQNAAQIRDTFFASGEMAVPLQVTPQALDPTALSVLLEIDGQYIGFAHRDGVPTPVAVSWPGSVGMARLALHPPAANVENMLSRDGPWSLFRLFDGAELRSTDAPDRKRAIFRVGGRIAIFQVQLGSVNNPFSLQALKDFSCPKSF